MDDLIQKWVWMTTMNHALGIVRNEYQRCVYPDYEAHRDIPYSEFLKNIFSYALENWKTTDSYLGSCSGHSGLDVGYWFETDRKGVFGKYKTMTVNISWSEVQRFMQKMLSEETKGQQIDLLELLAEIATNEQK